MSELHSDALVLFGATGDLAYKKIFPALQAMAASGRLDVPVIAVSREDWDIEGLRTRARESVEAHGGGVDPDAFAKLAGLFRYVGGDYNDPAIFDRLRKSLGDARRPVHYLAIPPSAFPAIVQGLVRSGCSDGARVVLEKPFGRDLASARELNRTLHVGFDESEVFRIDHYLGKEPVQNLVLFRLANSFLEPIWNRNYVESVADHHGREIRCRGARPLLRGGGGHPRRGPEPPPPGDGAVGDGAPDRRRRRKLLRDEKVKVVKSIRPLTGRSLVRGQFRGYRDEKGVASDSQVETFAAMMLHIDSWRWADVPFYIRTGKCLPLTATEILVRLRRPPQRVFSGFELPPGPPNYFRFRLGPEIEIAIGAQTKAPGQGALRNVELLACRDRRDLMEPYDRLLGAAMEGERLLFAREDEVESAWAVVDPILERASPLHEYELGSWGPSEADAMVSHLGGWHEPKRSAP